MQYYSLNKQSPNVNFKEATLLGQAPDKGLYFPATIPAINQEMIENIESFKNEDIALQVIAPYVGTTINPDILNQIVAETIDFSIPLVPITDSIASLELFHGPTLAFKDIGARFMSRCLGVFSKERRQKVTVLVATSGDTGGAVANGFYKVQGVEVVILYPSGKVSSVQEKQLTTLGHNIHALEVDGSFDDCQQLVKQAFADTSLTSKLFLTSANSINVARWLPQQFYYLFAYKQWKQKQQPPVISVPSGNFGNICAGILAHISGLPVKHFIAACNVNDIVSPFLEGGVLQPKKAVHTISNAMDVGNPSNFIRILEIFQQQLGDLKKVVHSVTVTETATRETIKRVLDATGYLLDPHGAVGYWALENYLEQYPDAKGMILETAHPVKFYDVVEPVIDQTIPLPDAIKEIINLPKSSVRINPEYKALEKELLRL
jgi:threonine synthase